MKNKPLTNKELMALLPEPSLLDRVISYISPEAGFKRMKNKLAAMGAYTGASTSRQSMKRWGGLTDLSPALADSEGREELQRRCASVDRNNSTARGAADNLVKCVLGSGVKHKSVVNAKVLGIEKAKASEIEKEIEYYTGTWMNSKYADITLFGSFHDFVRTSTFEELIAGDGLMVRRYKDPGKGKRKGAFAGTTFQFIEAARICNKDHAMNSDTLIDGVHISLDGVAVAFDILDSHPGDYMPGANKWTTIQAYDRDGNLRAKILYDRRRSGTYRGVPWLSIILEDLKLVGDIRASEAYKRLVQSFFTATITSESGSVLSTNNPSLEADQEGLEDDEMAMGPGVVNYLKPGEAVTFSTPPAGAADYAAFMEIQHQGMGMGVGIPYEVFIQHFSSSFSASRGSLLNAWMGFRILTARKACHVYQFAKECLVTELVARKVLKLPGYMRNALAKEAYLGSVWTGQAMPQLDELKAVRAAILREQQGYSTGEQNAAEMKGTDYEQNLIAKANEKALRESLGLSNESDLAEAIVNDTTDEDIDMNGDKA